MQQDLPTTTAVLERFPTSLDALLRGLPDAWTQAGDGGWTPFQIAAHLVDSERHNWLPRIRHILAHGATQPFPTFDRGGLERESAGRTPPQLLDEFARLRRENLTALAALNLSAADLAKTGQHPAFGPVTMSHLIATWCVHDLTHLHQLSRVLAHPYRDAVGPWTAYLGVLHCDAHGS